MKAFTLLIFLFSLSTMASTLLKPAEEDKTIQNAPSVCHIESKKIQPVVYKKIAILEVTCTSEGGEPTIEDYSFEKGDMSYDDYHDKHKREYVKVVQSLILDGYRPIFENSNTYLKE